MPNWCSGTLRLRGTLTNLKRFCREGIEGHLKFEVDTDTGFRYYDEKGLYIKNTQRAFLSDGKYGWTTRDHGSDKFILLCEFQQAWSINIEDWTTIANEYDVDINIDAFEKRMEFSQHIKIVDGNTTIEISKYKNYAWDCVCPMIGG